MSQVEILQTDSFHSLVSKSMAKSQKEVQLHVKDKMRLIKLVPEGKPCRGCIVFLTARSLTKPGDFMLGCSRPTVTALEGT